MEYSWIDRMRGVDKWPLADATVTTVEQVSEGGRGGAWRRIFFTYRCGAGDFGGRLSVDSYSSLYEFAVDDVFQIQYNPRRPSQFSCEEAKSLFSNVRLILGLVGVLFVLFVIAVEVFRL